MEIFPIGIVHSSIRSRSDMPVQGIDAEIEVFPEYVAALEGIAENSHLILICWLHEADRSILKAVARKVSDDLPERGVFSLRSPVRPNPLSVSMVRLHDLREGRILDLANVDLVDGTPVIDIKPYQRGWDCIFSATGHDRTEKIRMTGSSGYRESLIREALNYHGDLCRGVAVAVRVAEAAVRILGCDLAAPQVSVAPGPDPHIADALIGITGARPGNRRLRHPGGEDCVFFGPGVEVTFHLRDAPADVETILAAREESLFDCEIRARRD